MAYAGIGGFVWLVGWYGVGRVVCSIWDFVYYCVVGYKWGCLNVVLSDL